MPEPITPYAAARFGSERARPKILEFYNGAHGWEKQSQLLRLTQPTAEKLRDEGISMVRVRWHFTTQQVSIRRYLGG